MPTPEEIQASIALFDADVQRFNDILLGDENTEVVMSDTTLRPSITKAVFDRVDLVTNTVIYQTIAEGIAATTNGKYFFVPQSAPSATLYDLYKNNAGAALYINSYPAKAAFKGIFTYNGNDSKIPLVVNATGELLAWFDKSTGCISQIVSENDEYISAVVGEYLKTSPMGKTYTNTGVSPIVPMYTDALGNVLIGWDVENNRQVGVYEQSELAAGAALRADPLTGKSYTNTGVSPIIPIYTDALGNVLVGWDVVNNRQVGVYEQGVLAADAALQAAAVAAPIIESVPVPLPSTDVPEVTDWRMVMWDGDSTTVGVGGGTIINGTQPYSNLTFGGGPSSSKLGSDPIFFNKATDTVVALFETSARTQDATVAPFETPVSSTLNYVVERAVIEDGIDHANMILFGSTAGHGGYTVADLTWGQPWAQLAIDQLTEFRARAAAASKTYSLSCLALEMTINDAAVVTTVATYKGKVKTFLDGIETNLNPTPKQAQPIHAFLVAPYINTVRQKGRTLVLALQELVADGQPYFWLLPPLYHLPFDPDNIHMDALGYVYKGKLVGKHIKQLMDGNRPQVLRPISATYRDNTITCKFDIRFKPLVLDSINIGTVEDNGIRVVTNPEVATAGEIIDVAISNIRVVNGDSIVMTTASVPPAGSVLRFAMDYELTASPYPNQGQLSGATNIRDSYPDVAIISGVSCPLFDVCPSAELPIIFLGV